MEDFDGMGSELIKAPDRVTARIVSRIAVCHHHHTQSKARIPVDFELGQTAAQRCLTQRGKI